MNTTLERAKPLLRRLWSDYISRHKKVLAVATVLMTIEGSLLGVLSYMIQPMFDRVFVGGDASAVGLIAGSIFVLFGFRALAGFGQRYLVIRTGLKIVTSIQKDLTGHLVALDALFFQMNPPGVLIERVRGDAQALQSAASAVLISIGRDTVSLVSLLAVVIWIDWFWAVLVFAGLPLIALPVLKLQRGIRRTARAARERSAVISNRLDEIFHGIPAIKVNTLEAHEQGRFAATVDHYFRSERSNQARQAAMPATIDILAAVGFLGVLYYGGHEIIAGEKSLGEFMSFFTAMALLFDPLRRISGTSGQIQGALASLERIYALFDTHPTIVNRPAAPAIVPERDGDIAFEDVVFGYDGHPVLRGLSFTARAGETTALVGASGAGKTTVFNLLTRLLEPQTGRILIGGQDIGDFDLGRLRGHFALVSQDSYLFDETIRDNIRLGRMDATPEQIEAAAERATVTEFTSRFPNGLDTPAGPRGSALSGGQRQRVAIARAMLRDAPVLLLDEPTSALDARSEQVIQTALDRLSRGRTTLVIAHRLSTIRSADRIVVLDKGQLVDQGRHEELLAREGLYAQLYALQFQGNG